MFKREQIKKILQKATLLDSKYELFGSQKHRYVLNPPIDASYVRTVEVKYGFTLPEDYFQFITEIGDGGAGSDYGIYPFTNFMRMGSNKDAEIYLEKYKYGVGKIFTPRPMASKEVRNYGFSKEAFERNPQQFFVFEKYCVEDDENIASMDGYFVIGTHGCQWDFGVITAGDRRGQVFDTDNEGGYCFLTNNFQEFYQQWLEEMSNEEAFIKELEARRKLFSRKNK